MTKSSVKLSEMTPGALEDRMQALLHDVQIAGEGWADAKAEMEFCEENRRSVLAECMPSEGSMAAQEKAALLDSRYRTYLAELKAARHAANRQWVRYQALIAKLEIARSVFAFRREEMKRLGGV